MSAFSVARLETLAELEGNPLGLRIERFGETVAPASSAAPELDFVNRIEGLTGREQLGKALAFYAVLRARPWLELAPHHRFPLDEADVDVVGSQAVLYGRPTRRLAVPPSVGPAEDPEAAARIALEGHLVPDAVLGRHATALAAAVERVDGRFYVASVDGRTAATAVLTLTDGVGYLAYAATLPPSRGRGCHTALIAARLADAAAAECELVVATTELGSQSQRNLERAGLRMAYTKPVLRLTPSDAPARGGTA